MTTAELYQLPQAEQWETLCNSANYWADQRQFGKAAECWRLAISRAPNQTGHDTAQENYQRYRKLQLSAAA